MGSGHLLQAPCTTCNIIASQYSIRFLQSSSHFGTNVWKGTSDSTRRKRIGCGHIAIVVFTFPLHLLGRFSSTANDQVVGRQFGEVPKKAIIILQVRDGVWLYDIRQIVSSQSLTLDYRKALQ